MEMLRKDKTHFAVNEIVTGEVCEEKVMESLQKTGYGKCVFACDNNVNDHQTVNLEFVDGANASFCTNGITSKDKAGRRTRIFGTNGELEDNGQSIKLYDFLTNKVTEIDSGINRDGTIRGGHGGGDPRLMDAFINAIETNDQSSILTGPRETLRTHAAVFAAEKSRMEDRIFSLEEILCSKGVL
jgi:predicted dehydrogenase